MGAIEVSTASRAARVGGCAQPTPQAPTGPGPVRWPRARVRCHSGARVHLRRWMDAEAPTHRVAAPGSPPRHTQHAAAVALFVDRWPSAMGGNSCPHTSDDGPVLQATAAPWVPHPAHHHLHVVLGDALPRARLRRPADLHAAVAQRSACAIDVLGIDLGPRCRAYDRRFPLGISVPRGGRPAETAGACAGGRTRRPAGPPTQRPDGPTPLCKAPGTQRAAFGSASRRLPNGSHTHPSGKAPWAWAASTGCRSSTLRARSGLRQPLRLDAPASAELKEGVPMHGRRLESHGRYAEVRY